MLATLYLVQNGRHGLLNGPSEACHHHTESVASLLGQLLVACIMAGDSKSKEVRRLLLGIVSCGAIGQVVCLPEARDTPQELAKVRAVRALPWCGTSVQHRCVCRTPCRTAALRPPLLT